MFEIKKSIIVYISGAVLLAASFINCRAQARSNLEIFDNEISARLERIFFKPDLLRDVQFIFIIKSENNNENEIKFLTSIIKKTADKNKIRASFTNIMESNDSLYNAFRVDIIGLKTKYPGFASNKFLGTKLVNRSISANVKVEISGTYSYFNTDSILVNYRDKVDYDDIGYIESEDYDFTQAKHPEVSFYEDIVFPAAIITVTVMAAILFFTIRSK